MRQQPWFESFKWKDNPFKIQPDPDHIIGFVDKRAKILNYIHSHDPFMVIGPTGSGKTTLLLWAQRHKDSRYIYHNFITDDENKLPKNIKGNLFDKLRKRDVVLLLDEAQEMSERMAKLVRAMFDHGKVKSMVLAAIKTDLENLQDPLVNRIGSRIVETRHFTEEEADQFIRQRIYANGKHNPFDDNALREIFIAANHHPRKILELCEQMCMKAHEIGHDYIGSEFVNRYLQKPITSETIKDKIMTGPSDLQSRLRQKLEETFSKPANIPSKMEKVSPIETLKREPLIRKEIKEKIITQPKRESIELSNIRKTSSESPLSPSQLKILQTIDVNEMSAVEIAERIGGNRASVAKQLSRLALNTDVATLNNKGIKKPLVKAKRDARPVVYTLTAEGKKHL